MGNSRVKCDYDPIERVLSENGSVLVFCTKTSIVTRSIFKEFEKYLKVTPSYWNILKRTTDYGKFFRRGHLIASTFGGDKKMSDTSNRGKLSQFIQTKWSNENDNGRNPYCQWHFEEKIKEKVVTDSVCIDSRPIYQNKADKIPIGIHLQAVTEKESLFNVFLPNIDPNIKINYKNCTFKLNK